MPAIKSAREAIDEFVEAIAQHYLLTKEEAGEQSESVAEEFVSSIETDLKSTLRHRLSVLETVKEIEGTDTVELAASAVGVGQGRDRPEADQLDLTLDPGVDVGSVNGAPGANGSGTAVAAQPQADAEQEKIGGTLDTELTLDGITDRKSDHEDFENPTNDGNIAGHGVQRPSVRPGKSSGAADLSFDNAKMAALKSKKLAHKHNTKAPEPPAGYEIISTLGKGGMGIVFKAKHVPLNRIVAVKMIISGELASEDMLVRFQREAEAAAHLSHPNIVSVYEVGTHKGLPYFSLEFVDGPSLSDLMKETTLSAKDAAALLIPVARAVQYSHEMGVLHRDLKPQNILLTQDGLPKVADFGLAKRLDTDDNDTDKTRAGVILGTPGYMAPEQARDTDSVGPQTDVYALGSILYYMMTGRPPFTAPTPFETVRQLLANEPVPPSKMQTGLDQDLETICLKSLEKELPKRYQSAGEFADELQRFLDGTPIIARPITRTERLKKWCKRNPKIATLSALAASLAMIVMIGGPSTAAVIWGQKQEVVAAKDLADQNAQRAAENEVIAVEAQGVAEKNAEAAAVQEKNAIDALKSMTFVVQRKMAGQTNLVGLREELLKTVHNGLARMEKNQNNARAQDMISAGIHVRLGDINMEIGRVAKATEEYNKCLVVFQSLEKESSIPSPEQNWSKLYQLLGDAARAAGDYDLAIQHHEKSLEIRREWVKKSPSPLSTNSMAISLGKLGSVCRVRGKLDDAKKYMVEAAEQWEKACQERPTDGNARDELLGAKMVLSKVMFQQGETAAALKMMSSAVDGIHQRLDRNANSITVRRNAAMFDTELAVMQLFAGDTAKAEENFSRAVTVFEELKESEPHDLDIHYKLEGALYGLSVAQDELGQTEAGRELMRRVVDLRRQSVELEKANVTNKIRLLMALARSGDVVEGVEIANELSESIAKDDVNRYELACGYAQLARARRSTEEGSDVAGIPTEKMLASAAIEALQDALKHDFGRGADLRLDPDLDPLRKTPEFAALIKNHLQGT